MAEITREQIEKLRGLIKDRDDAASDMARWPGYEYDEAYRQASDRLHSAAEKALPALLDLAASALARGGAVESATDQSKGGDANADLSATSGIQTSPDATSPGRECEPAGASEELCRRLEERGAFWKKYWTSRSLPDPDSAPLREAASLIRRLERERDEAREECNTKATDDFDAREGLRERARRAESRATAAEAEAERLMEALEPFARAGEKATKYRAGKPDDGGFCSILVDGKYDMTYADLRRAHSAFEGKTNER